MQRRSPTPADKLVWSAAALLLLLGLLAPALWKAADPTLAAEVAALEKSPLDPWGSEFGRDDEVLNTLSPGPDRAWGTADDLSLSLHLSRARASRVLPALAILGVMLLAGWELGFLVFGLMGGRWRGWVDEGLIAGGWAAVGAILVYGVAELLVRQEVMEHPRADWLVVSWEVAVAGSGAVAGATVGVLLRLRLLQAAPSPASDPLGQPAEMSEPPAPTSAPPSQARQAPAPPKEIQDGD